MVSSEKKNKNNELSVLRHSAAHLVAHALKELKPEVLLTIGPATADGFFYDVYLPQNLTQEDLEVLENKMHEISNKDYPIEHKEISKEEARKIYKDNRFKLELIESIPGDTVGLAIQGDFIDLCRGGHVKSTGEIKHFKLTGLSGSYWRADKTGQQLQRVHGTAFFTQQDLEAYQELQEELQKYDHRRLGKQLELFSFSPEAHGFPFFHPKGKVVINVLTKYMRELHRVYNYSEVSTPTMLNDDLWKRSGHYDFYKENMYFTCVDDESYAIKPMNCPGAFLIYKTRPRSYRELPLKLAEFGHVHRHELSGVLHGLMRVRAFTQDDAHIFCTVAQIEDEIKTILKITQKVLERCGFKDVKLALSTKPKKALGSDELWNKAIVSLKKALDDFGQEYEIKEGEGAFYGPKIEIGMTDSSGREWQCGTAQLDFFQSQNFNLNYVTGQGSLEKPVIIHQAIYGSLERFFAILLEHYKGHFPFWLAPVQVKILSITDKQKDYALEIYQNLNNQAIRVEMDDSSDPIGAKIKNAQLQKIPFMVIVGQKEVEKNTISIRLGDGSQRLNISLDDALKEMRQLNDFDV